VRFRAVPGNHDVGDPRYDHQPVNETRLQRWRSHFGPDRWIEDVEDCRLIGFNAMLLDSGEPEEALQAEWLKAVMNDAGDRRIAWFLHRPLFLDSPGEGDTGYWSVKPSPRAGLLDLARRYSVALVASGHLHKAHDFTRDGIRYIWAPSSAFLVGPRMKPPPMPGEHRLGAIVYEIGGRNIEAQIVVVTGLTPHWLDDVAEEVYPRRPDKSAALPSGLRNR